MPTLVNAPNQPAPITLKRKLPHKHEIQTKKRKKPEITQETPANSTTATNEETELLKRKTKALKSKVFRLTKKLNTPSKQSSQCKKLNIAIECISQYLNGPALEFFKTQIKAGKMKLRGYKWSEKDKSFAITLYNSSPKTYKLLSSVFALPSIRTLRRTMQKIDINCGFHPNILDALKTRCASMDDKTRLCAVVYDEMAIKQHMEYNNSSDRIEGFESIASNANSKYIANHAGVFMVKGLCFKWKQPVGYFFSSYPINKTLLKKLMFECIEKLLGIWLLV